jgi:hypothetical protein
MNIKNVNWKKVGLTALGIGATLLASFAETKSNDGKLKDLVDDAVAKKLSESSTK